MSPNASSPMHEHRAKKFNAGDVDASNVSVSVVVRRWVGGSVGYVHYSDNARYVGGCVGSVDGD